MEFCTCGSGKWRQQSHPVAALVDAVIQGRQVVLADRVLDVGDQLGALVREVIAPAHQITGGAHRGRIDVGLRDHPPAQQRSDLVRIDAVVLGLAPVNGAHVQGVAKNKPNALALTQVGQPVPGEHALHRHHQIVAEALDCREERPGAAVDVA